jgi:CRP/FNR family cyclic AMP-dependent transcriptional regulator
VLSFAQRRQFQAGATLYMTGDRSSTLYVLSEGIVRTYWTGAGGRELTVGIWLPGDLVGAPDVATGRRALSAAALRDVVAYEFAADSLRTATVEVPAFGWNLVLALSFKVRWVSMIAANLRTKDALTRLCELILMLGEVYGVRDRGGKVTLTRKFTQEELALMIGCTRQWTSRSLTALRQQQLVTLDKRGIMQFDRAKLRGFLGARETG